MVRKWLTTWVQWFYSNLIDNEHLWDLFFWFRLFVSPIVVFVMGFSKCSVLLICSERTRTQMFCFPNEMLKLFLRLGSCKSLSCVVPCSQGQLVDKSMKN